MSLHSVGDVRNKGVIVTGGSRGLGAALTRELAGRGARVLAIARHRDALGEVVQDVRARGGEAHGYVADIADKEATYAIAAIAAERVGPVDVLVHNASTLGPLPMRPLLDLGCEDLEDTFRVNVLGPFRLTKAVAGNMAVRGTGLVVHVSSDAAVNAYERWGAYGVTKAAFDHLARVFAAELRAAGVRFLAVDPGEMNTKMHADAIPDADPSTLADPRDVARKLVDMFERLDRIEHVRVGAEGAPA